VDTVTWGQWREWIDEGETLRERLCERCGGSEREKRKEIDAIITVNSLWYFATSDTYLSWYLIPLVKPGGEIGVVVPGFYKEIATDYPDNVPDHLKPYWDSCCLSAWHSAEWWRQHFLKTNQVEMLLADNFADDEGYQTYLRWERIIEYPEKIAEDDAGRTITFVRLLARRKQPQPTGKSE
jgi:hypothetical protein